ncbi:hypothetical protein [Bradyrhizobium sp. AUGA SZCCT0176]|nr:hypothetical protein [Bradyrhizobium sp. AUGA SZCCT0176]
MKMPAKAGRSGSVPDDPDWARAQHEGGAVAALTELDHYVHEQ